MTKVYNFKNNQVIVDGLIITGYADGDAIQAERNEDKNSQFVGVDGNVTYNQTNNDTGVITLTLKPTSSSLPALKALYKSGKLFNVLIQDTANNVRVTGEDCLFQTWPSFTRGEEAAGLEIPILCAYYKED
ncbi:phage structural protein [Solibacillus isronensis]|uniref:phage structural protein n=1 Tax=Solibacillus isronensis TaxID=412383 RepID=UPI0039A15ACC